MKKRGLLGMIALAAMLAIALVLGACDTNSSARQNLHTVTFSVIGENGTLSAAVGETPITSGGEVLAGNDLIFTATPALGYRVKEWRRNGAVVTGNTSNILWNWDLAGNLNVTVEFEAIWGPTDDISGEFTDPLFQSIIRDIIGIPTGPFTRGDVAIIDMLFLDSWYLRLSSLAGIQHLVNLEVLDASYSSLPWVDLRYNTNLMFLFLDSNNLQSLDLSGNPNLVMLSAYGNPMLTTIDLSHNTELISITLSSTGLAVLDLSANINLMSVAANNNPNLTTVIWPAHPAALMGVGMLDSGLTSINLTNAPNLTSIDISGNNILSVNLSNNTSLEMINLWSNNLSCTTDINLTGNISLETVFLAGNQFTSFNGSFLPPSVTELWLYNNNLTSVDLSSNTALVDLRMNRNNLTTLDFLSANVNLEFLAVGGNQLKGHFDFSGFPHLHTLYLNENYITSINIMGTSIGTVPPYFLPSLWVVENNMTGLNDVNGWRELGLFPGGDFWVGTDFWFFPQRGYVADVPVILTTAIPTARVGEYFSFFFESDSQIMPTWTVDWTDLTDPPKITGLSLQPERGELHGMPLTVGYWDFDVIVTNDEGEARKTLRLTIDPAP